MPEGKKRVFIPAVENLGGKEMADVWGEEIYGAPGQKACQQDRGRIPIHPNMVPDFVIFDDMEGEDDA